MAKAVKAAAAAGALMALCVSIGWVAGTIASGAYVDAEPAREELDFGDQKRIVERTLIKVPADYGNLVFVTPRAEGSELWFSDGGLIRNVAVGAGSILIQRSGRTAR